MKLAALLAAGMLAVVTALGVTFGAFSATTSNGGNSFTAAASFPPDLQMATGTYAGNDVDDQLITTGFQPDLVIVKDDLNQVAMGRTSTMPANESKTLVGGNNLMNTAIKNFQASGFTVGTHGRANQSGHTYYWAAFKAASGVLHIGTYTGNGSSQSLTGVGFSPEYVAIMSAESQRAVQRFAGMTRSFQFDTDAGANDQITSLDADGFSVASGAQANANNVQFHYVAFNDVSGSIKTGSYSGNATDNRDVTGAGFQPDYVMVRANDTSATGQGGVQRPASLTGDNTLAFWAAAAAPNFIQAIQPDGFQVGTDNDVNQSGVMYHYLATRNTAP